MRHFTAPITPAIAAIAAAALLLAACADEPTRPLVEPDARAAGLSATATFRVTSTADAVDARPGDGVCRTRAGACTLRAAVQEANALAGADAVVVPAGVYDIALGPLVISSPMQITGAGAGRTALDAGHRDFSILEVGSSAGRVAVTRLTARNLGSQSEECSGSAVVVRAGATAVLRLVELRNNGCVYGGAGAIGNAGTVWLDRSVVADNASRDPSVIANVGTMTILRSTVTGSFSYYGCPAISNWGRMVILNSTISRNGGIESIRGAICNSGSLALNNVTLTQTFSEAGDYSGGIYGDASVSNSIIVGNLGDDCVGTISSRGYNLIGRPGSACTIVGNRAGNLIGVDPRLGPLQDNGGPTPTHALLAGSPARNAANPARPGSGYPACQPLDQRGLSRTRDARCDMGAVEMP